MWLSLTPNSHPTAHISYKPYHRTAEISPLEDPKGFRKIQSKAPISNRDSFPIQYWLYSSTIYHIQRPDRLVPHITESSWWNHNIRLPKEKERERERERETGSRETKLWRKRENIWFTWLDLLSKLSDTMVSFLFLWIFFFSFLFQQNFDYIYIIRVSCFFFCCIDL